MLYLSTLGIEGAVEEYHELRMVSKRSSLPRLYPQRTIVGDRYR